MAIVRRTISSRSSKTSWTEPKELHMQSSRTCMHVMHISLSSTHPFHHHPLPFCHVLFHMLHQSEPSKLYFLRRPSKAACKMNNSPARYRRGKGWDRDKAGGPEGTARVVTVPLPATVSRTQQKSRGGVSAAGL